MSKYSAYPQKPEVYKYWIDTILDEAENKLTDWERDFINSLSTRSYISEKQAQILERIYSEKTA